jgi:hypothetical protein
MLGNSCVTASFWRRVQFHGVSFWDCNILHRCSVTFWCLFLYGKRLLVRKRFCPMTDCILFEMGFYILICQRIARQLLNKHPAMRARNSRTNVYRSLLGKSQRAKWTHSVGIMWRVFCRSAPKFNREKQTSFAGSRKLEEWVIDGSSVEFQGSRVTKQEIWRCHSDLKC